MMKDWIGMYVWLGIMVMSMDQSCYINHEICEHAMNDAI